jgi:hypothetical protein
MSTFTHAGTSRLNGSVKVRFANDALRVKVLEKNGHTEVDLMPLPNPMTKEEAVAFLLKIELSLTVKSRLQLRTHKSVALHRLVAKIVPRKRLRSPSNLRRPLWKASLPK